MTVEELLRTNAKANEIEIVLADNDGYKAYVEGSFSRIMSDTSNITRTVDFWVFIPKLNLLHIYMK